MSRLLLTFYSDDFTGSTDALEQLTLAGIRTVLFIEPPKRRQLARFKNLQAIGVAGMTRSMAPNEMGKVLRPALKKLKALGAPHVHYKVCSTFDSSPKIGSIGRVIDVATEIFPARFVPLLVAAPALGRYTVFGNHFARYGIGSAGEIHRLDRHPSISKHPITPMTEADLRLHLARQTKKRIELFDILKLALPLSKARPALARVIKGGAEVVLFDALYPEQLQRIGELIDGYASRKQPLFSVGSSGVEAAWAAYFNSCSSRRKEAQTPDRSRMSQLSHVGRYETILVASGSCSPVTAAQIRWATKNGFTEVALDTKALISDERSAGEIRRLTDATVSVLKTGRSVIVHTVKQRPMRIAETAKLFGSALGSIARQALSHTGVRRLCVAGGDTASYAARAMGIEALEMIARLTPGAPLCRAYAPDSPVDGREVVFKGGQVGAEDYFGLVANGRPG